MADQTGGGSRFTVSGHAAMRDVTAAGLIQNGTLCSRCMVPSGATADRAESATG